MERFVTIPLGIVLLLGLLLAERFRGPGFVLAFKTPLSILFVVTAFLQPIHNTAYFGWVVAGLVLGLAGDVCLALPGRRAFRAGVVSFLGGHIMYVIAFAWIAPVSAWYTAGTPGVIILSSLVYWWLRPYAGAMARLVIMYIVVISVMLIGAWGVFFTLALPVLGEWAILAGAMLFYVSDLFVARDRFVTQEFTNRLVGLPMYYAGQFLLALSVGLVP
jgi:uncharacterized membrane protein YhhN